jgi:lipopolysaccharide/colanic/teichoic acid biosynthesis glycosyltransferase
MCKRLFDLVVASAGLFLLAPVLLFVGILISLGSPGPVFYCGNRIGKDGKPFRMLKFRTMVVNADQIGSALTHGGDPRVTPVGRILRKWKIDEIPQLINVVRGEMSLVGPRPESPGYVQHYTPAQRRVLLVKPGMTGLTQIRYRHEETLLKSYADRERAYVETIMPQKLALDLEYVEHQSFFSDLVLILLTLLALSKSDEASEGLAGIPHASTTGDA